MESQIIDNGLEGKIKINRSNDGDIWITTEGIRIRSVMGGGDSNTHKAAVDLFNAAKDKSRHYT